MKTNVMLMLGSLLFGVCFLWGCKTEEETTLLTPKLSQTQVSIEEGSTSTEITISEGLPPYTITASIAMVQIDQTSASTFTLTGISAGNTTLKIQGKDGGETRLSVVVTADVYKAFKADATTRIEKEGVVLTDGVYFLVDQGTLHSTQYKVGWGSSDGETFYYVGWDEGYLHPKVYTVAGSSALYSLQCLQDKEHTLWLVWKETQEAPVQRMCITCE
jgi:hypothetical protein